MFAHTTLLTIQSGQALPGCIDSTVYTIIPEHSQPRKGGTLTSRLEELCQAVPRPHYPNSVHQSTSDAEHCSCCHIYILSGNCGEESDTALVCMSISNLIPAQSKKSIPRNSAQQSGMARLCYYHYPSYMTLLWCETLTVPPLTFTTSL